MAPLGFMGAMVPGEKVNVVFLVDASSSVAKVMAPFTWDGSRDQSGRPKFSGTRPPNTPPDLYGQPCRDAIAKLEVGDRVRVGTFATSIRLGEVFSDGASAAKAASGLLRVPDEERSGPSRVWDAVDEALAKIEVEPLRRVVVLVTDGRANEPAAGDAASDRRPGFHQCHRGAPESGSSWAHFCSDGCH